MSRRTSLFYRRPDRALSRPSPAALEVLAERDFRLLFFARATSVFGDSIAPVALAFATLGLTGSASALGLVLAARTIPYAIFLPVGGVWADRFPRQRLMIASDLVRFATQGVFAGLLVTGTARLWEIALLQALGGAGSAFFQPASTAITPETVSVARLQQANALLSFTRSASGIGGPIAAGALLATIGSGYAIAADALTFGASAAFLLQLRLPRATRRAAHEPFVVELAAGWAEVHSRSWVLASVFDFMLFQILVIASVFVLGPLIAAEKLHGATAWAVIVAAIGVGAAVGDLLALRLEPRHPLLAGHLARILVTPMMVLLALAAPTFGIAAAGVFLGAALSFSNTLWFTALQENVPAHALSRVASYDWMGSSVLGPIGYAIIGPLAAVAGVRGTLIGAAALTVVLQAWVCSLPAVRELRRLHDRVLPPPAATTGQIMDCDLVGDPPGGATQDGGTRPVPISRQGVSHPHGDRQSAAP
jgi:MFS family permease